MKGRPGAPRLEAPKWLPRAARALALVASLACLVAVTVFEVSNNDVWLHLKTGELVVSQGRVPTTDPYSFVTAGRPWVAHEWLSGVVFYLVFALVGVNGLVALKVACLAACLVLHWSTARLLGGRLSVFLPVLAMVLYMGGERFIERPHVFTYLLTAALLNVLFRHRERGRDARLLWPVVPLHVLWVNLHGGWVQGVALLAAFGLGEALVWARASFLGAGADRAPTGRQVLTLAALVPASLVAMLINPYGARALLLPFELTGMRTFMARVYEWQPPWAPSFNTTTMLVLYVLLVATLCSTFYLASRLRVGEVAARASLGHADRLMVALPWKLVAVLAVMWFLGSGTRWTPGAVRAGLVILGLMFAGSVVAAWRGADLAQAGVFGLLYLLSLRHNRAVTDAALVALPVVVAAASALLDRYAPGFTPALRAGRRAVPDQQAPAVAARPDRSSPVAVLAGSVLLVAVAAQVAVFGYRYDFSGVARMPGLGVAASVPMSAVGFVAKNRIAGNAFVTYSFAAPLVFRAYPAVKVNMDSRNEVYGEDLYREYEGALTSPDALRRYLAAHHVDFFLLGNETLRPDIYGSLVNDGGWVPVYRDEEAIILLRRTAANEATIARFGPAFSKRKPTLTFPDR